MKKICLFVILFGLMCAKEVKATSPSGYWDSINCDYVAGWVVDTDKVNETTSVHVYSDRREDGSGGFFWGGFVANIYRADLPFVNKNHGFRFNLPAGLKNGREHEVWMYGIDLTGNEHLFMGKKTITCDGGSVNVTKSNLPSSTMYWIDPYKIRNNSYVNRFYLNNKSEFEEVSSWQFFLVALQGLVNRVSPRIYVSDTGYDLNDLGKDYWKSEVEAKIGKSMIAVENNDPMKLAEIFKGESVIKGLAIYDKSVWTDFNLGDVVNLLTGYCAINNCIPVTTEIETGLRSKSISWPVVADFRGANSNNPVTKVGYSWNHEGINRYISEMLISKANNEMLGYLQPQMFILPRDYFFAHKIIPVFIRKDASSFEEESILKLMDRGIKPIGIVLGQAGSHNSDWIRRVMGRYGIPLEGKYEEGIDDGNGLWPLTSQKGLSLTYIHVSPNLSVHSGFRDEVREPNRCYETDLENKIYLNFNLSDGDNISWVKQLWRQSWEGEERSQAMTWSYNPIMADLQPIVLKWFFENSTSKDSWISWGGYNSVEVSKHGMLEQFVAKSCDYLNNRLKSQKTYLTFGAIKAEQISVWARSGCFKGILSDYNIQLGSNGLPSRSYGNATYTDAGTLIARPIISLHLSSGQTEADFVNQLRQYAPSNKPAFLNVWVLGNGAFISSRQQLEGTISRLDSNIYKVVGVDDFIYLYRKSVGLSTEGVCQACSVNATISGLIDWYNAYRNGLVNSKADFNCDSKVDVSDLLVWYREYRK